MNEVPSSYKDTALIGELQRVLEAIYDTKITGSFDFDDEDVLGKSCHAEMRISTYEGKEHIEIIKWSPIGKEAM